MHTCKYSRCYIAANPIIYRFLRSFYVLWIGLCITGANGEGDWKGEGKKGSRMPTNTSTCLMPGFRRYARTGESRPRRDDEATVRACETSGWNANGTGVEGR